MIASRARPSAALLVALASLLLLPACGSDGGSAAPEDCRTVTQGADGTSRATIVGKDLGFDVSCLEVQPGTLQLTFENRDEGVVHDLHVTGMGVNRSTELAKGPTTQQLSVILSRPGRYTFACDPHATMEGTIQVVQLARDDDGSHGG